ncbi:membrane stabilizing protein MspA [Staphylococcus ratti]|uniref:Membrane stabilizing protein MspA n=1 Tax=Staphylococcus ratti TaxID=2892440 RepID=A0ABY3PE19_9STAP|nr:membrane stabilizing protein MspA [Staphylococcus ratti]UEX90571.1 membrane stabilizing protein MspA [Staphylococcus ratti]
MLIYFLLLPLLYLIVSYLSIFKMNSKFASVLRIIMAVILIFVIATSLTYHLMNTWWLFVVLLLLIGNVETTAFKFSKNDAKGVSILNMMTVLIFIIYTILTIVLI